MTFNDIFKSSFLEKVSSISVFDMILTILLSFGVGLFIFLVYKKTYRGVMYSAGFGTDVYKRQIRNIWNFPRESESCRRSCRLLKLSEVRCMRINLRCRPCI